MPSEPQNSLKLSPPIFIWILILVAALIGSIQIWQVSVRKIGQEAQPRETNNKIYCTVDSDCWCRNFDGAHFSPGKAPSVCNLQTKTCNSCYYE